MLVDCGLFQGLKELRERNWQPLPIAPTAHRRRRADARAPRSLRLPAAAGRAGFPRPRVLHRRARGSLHASCCPTPRTSRKRTRATRTAHGYSKHHPALPLYTRVDAARALTQLQPVGYDRPVPVVPGRRGRVHQCRPPARVGLRARDGRRTRRCCSAATSAATAGRCCPIRRRSTRADVLLLESTYGDRLHEPDDDGARLAAIINDAVGARRQADHPGVRDRPRRGGALLAEAARRRASGFRCCRCIVDSPMAADALQFYTERADELDPDMTAGGERGVVRASAPPG